MTHPSGSSKVIYPWYEIATDNGLEQGDLLDRFPLFVALPLSDGAQAGDAIRAVVQTYNVVIVSQSCDLVQGKLDNVLVCPHFSIEELRPTFPELASDKGRKRVKQGVIASLHLLPPCELPGHERQIRIVNFRQISTMPFELVRRHAERQDSRVRLLPPYREHLAQAFARFVMRVGLPVDFPDP